ncbi:MAG TPA: hypothetical protein VLM79_30235 [Kofleriaceae bacterium]|nr:hypothetical protein [Kofleriaceae bacterium]
MSAEVAAAAPFDAAQLAAAIRIRVPAGRAPIRVRVFAITGGVRVEARGSARDIPLGAFTGAAAARLVALAASDLFVDDLGVTVLEDPAAAGVAASVDARARGRITVSALGSAAMWSHALGGLAVDAAWSSGNRLVALEAGGGTLVGSPLRLTAGVVRVGGGVRLGIAELRATATVVPLYVSDGVGDQTVLWGIGASARLRIPLVTGVRAVLATGIDLFATRSTYVVEEMPVLETPRATAWLAAGVEVTP